MYVYVYLHIANTLSPLEGSKSTWSNNNKITSEYISRVYISSRVCRCNAFWTFVDRRMSERRINYLAGVRPSFTIFFGLFCRPKLIEFSVASRHFHSSAIRTRPFRFHCCDVIQGALCIRSGCILLLRGDPRQSHRGNVIIAQSASRALSPPPSLPYSPSAPPPPSSLTNTSTYAKCSKARFSNDALYAFNEWRLEEAQTIPKRSSPTAAGSPWMTPALKIIQRNVIIRSPILYFCFSVSRD